MSISYLDSNYPIASGNVEFLVGGAEYFTTLQGLIENLGSGDKLYLMNWLIISGFWFRTDTDDFSADHLQETILHHLLEAVSRGVDVRVLLWVNTNLFEPLYPLEHNTAFVSEMVELADNLEDFEDRVLENSDIVPTLEDASRRAALLLDDRVRRNNRLPFKNYMLNNLVTAHQWRNFETVMGKVLQNRIVVNTLDSAFGGCHAKFALALEQNPDGMRGQAFTGGIDLDPARYSLYPYHAYEESLPNADPRHVNYWHDIMASVTGTPAIRQMFDLYQTLWNANVRRKLTYNPDVTAFIGDETYHVPCVPAGAQLIENQLLDPGDEPTSHKIQSVSTIPNTFHFFGTSDNPGIGEPPIDAFPDGHFSLRDAIRRAFARAEHYIYVEDQAMQSLELYGLIVNRLKQVPGLRVILVRGGDPADAPSNVADKIVKRDHYDRLSPEEKQRIRRYEANYTVHSKLFLVDDKVAVVGSGGFFTRSMTEELEHGIAVVDDADSAAPTINSLRKKLWGIHLHSIDFEDPGYDDLATAIDAWFDPSTTFEANHNGGQITPFDWQEHQMIPFPDVIGDIANLLNISLPNQDDLPQQVAQRKSQYTNYVQEQALIFAHMVMYEWPYTSWLNPSSLPAGSAMPQIESNRVPVNVATNLAVRGPASNSVLWEYIPTDGLSMDDASPATYAGQETTVRFRSPGMKMVVASVDTGLFSDDLKIPFVIQVVESSGPQWVHRYQGSTDLNHLKMPFLGNLTNFLTAVVEAGITADDIEILSTYRPAERAYLMASSYLIFIKNTSPLDIKHELAHIPMSWVHYDLDGNPDIEASRKGAEDLYNAFNIGKAVYPSNHSKGTAIDMKINVNSPTTVFDADGREHAVSKEKDLYEVSATFGVLHMPNSNHWSLTGT
jgi:phosphatidylserine/phosphatidylglycerophosphate/cardiolipin synthase-like enzyme